ncbi:MAG: hypothetical protein NZ870_04030 [bacterium]|nr:hypothetical protein [bacterium]
MDKIDAAYVLGIVDCLGHFTLVDYKGYCYPKFVVYTQNRSIAQILYSFFNIGKIIEKSKDRKKTLYIYYVSKYDELKEIVNFFENHKLNIKYNEFNRFRDFFITWHPKIQRRSREENVKALKTAIKMYKEGYPIKEIILKTRVSLNRLYMVLKSYNLKRYNKYRDEKVLLYSQVKS